MTPRLAHDAHTVFVGGIGAAHILTCIRKCLGLGTLHSTRYRAKGRFLVAADRSTKEDSDLDRRLLAL